MYTIKTTKLVVIIATFSLQFISSDLMAQTLVKGVRCSDVHLNSSYDLGSPKYFHENRTSVTQNVTMQVIRDGCVPRSDGGRFDMWRVTTSGGGSARAFSRFGRHTNSYTMPVLSSYRVFITFRNADLSDRRVRGSFDYVYSVD